MRYPEGGQHRLIRAVALTADAHLPGLAEGGATKAGIKAGKGGKGEKGGIKGIKGIKWLKGIK